MAKKEEKDTAKNAVKNGEAAPAFVLHAQYLKDLTFENPKPLFFMSNREEFKPDISVNVQVNARHLTDEVFEVVLEVNTEAKKANDKMFSCKVQYAALTGIRKDLMGNDTEVRKILLEDCPRLVFPFVRNIVAGMTQESGFPPLVLQPVDFTALNKQQSNSNSNAGRASVKAANESVH